jgi:hypothetical protein
MLHRFGQRARFLPVAVLTAIAFFAFGLPAKADDPPATRSVQAKRTTTSLGSATSQSVGAATGQSAGAYAPGFIYFPGAQPGMNIGGRLNVGKSHLYVPYYGNISNDPSHPGVQGTAGIAYGFRTWDISVFNGGFGSTQPGLPAVDAPPKANPALSLSIRF